MTTTLNNYLSANVGTTPVEVYKPTTAGIQATVIGMTLSNTTTTPIMASVTLTSGATTVYLIKNTLIPDGNSLSVLGDSKFIVEQNDSVKVFSSVQSSLDVLLSTVEIA